MGSEQHHHSNHTSPDQPNNKGSKLASKEQSQDKKTVDQAEANLYHSTSRVQGTQNEVGHCEDAAKRSTSQSPDLSHHQNQPTSTSKHGEIKQQDDMQDLNKSGWRSTVSEDDDDSDDDCVIVSATKPRKSSDSSSGSDSSSDASEGGSKMSGPNHAVASQSQQVSQAPNSNAPNSASTRITSSDSNSSQLPTTKKHMYLVNGKVISSDVELSSDALREVAKKIQFPPYVSTKAADAATSQLSRLQLSDKNPLSSSEKMTLVTKGDKQVTSSATATSHDPTQSSRKVTEIKSASAPKPAINKLSEVLPKLQETKPCVQAVPVSQISSTIPQVPAKTQQHEASSYQSGTEAAPSGPSSQPFVRHPVQGPTSFAMIKPQADQAQATPVNLQQLQYLQQQQMQQQQQQQQALAQSAEDLRIKANLESRLRRQKVSDMTQKYLVCFKNRRYTYKVGAYHSINKSCIF